MKCLINGREVIYPCSRNCPLYGDCVTAFETHKKGNVRTNADRIRAMSDEELARFFYEQIDSFCTNRPECRYLLDTPNGIPDEKCIGCALDWLKQPAKEEAE